VRWGKLALVCRQWQISFAAMESAAGRTPHLAGHRPHQGVQPPTRSAASYWTTSHRAESMIARTLQAILRLARPPTCTSWEACQRYGLGPAAQATFSEDAEAFSSAFARAARRPDGDVPFRGRTDIWLSNAWPPIHDSSIRAGTRGNHNCEASLPRSLSAWPFE